MFTPSRSHTPVSSGSSRRRSAAPFSLTPRRSQLSGSKTSLTRRSHYIQRSSPADSLGHASPSLTSVFNTTNYSITSTGSSLPVLVNEAINLADKSQNITAQISENGWAWLVCDRRLFVWRFKQGASKSALCKELTLPTLSPSESAHDAGLIYVGKSGSSSSDGTVSLLVVTPLGSIRYWPNIIQSISSAVEMALDGIGTSSTDEECFKLMVLDSGGYLLGTTKGALFHLLPDSNTVTSTRLQVSHGMLAGIGRRVSSFFFSSAQDVDMTDFILLPTRASSPPEILMLTTTALQKWRLASVGPDHGTDHMVSQVTLQSLLVEAVSDKVWGKPAKDFRMWTLDIALASKHSHVSLLLAVADMHSRTGSGVVINFVVCLCPPSVLEEARASELFTGSIEVVLLNHSEVLQNEDESKSFLYKLIIPDVAISAPEHAILWRDDNILVKSVAKGNLQPEDAVPVDSSGDSVLGAGKFNGRCVLLTKNNGLLMVNTSGPNRSHVSQNIEDSFLNTPTSSRPQTPLGSLPGTPTVSKGKIEQLEASENGAQRLQAAFIHFNRMNIGQAKSIVSETFPPGGTDTNLDEAALFVSQELIDDYPAQDPRWAESVPHDAGGSSSSLILLHQLEDKQKAHQLYLNFLTEVGILQGLSTTSDGDRRTLTQWLLVEHGEKLSAAITLRQKHLENQGVVDSAIRKVLEKRNRVHERRGLTPQDVFYREVSRIQDIFGCLLDTEDEMIGNSVLLSREIFTAVAGVNDIFEGMLSSACQYRRSKGIPGVNDQGREFMPWTVSSGRNSIREVILRQHKLTVTRGLPEAEDGQQRAVLHSHLVALTDLVLSSYRQQMDSLVGAPNLSARRDEIDAAYKRHRTGLILPLLDAGLVDRAAMLAEKYKDFGILMELCDRNREQDRLSKYMSDFAAEGFSDFLFNWYLEHGKFRQLLECTSSNPLTVTDYNEKLSEFLSSHPKIAWLHQIRTGDFAAAHDTLLYLAAIETQSASKKGNLLSLSKLSAVFSDEDEGVVDQKLDDINMQHTLLQYQETLPTGVLEKIGMTVDNMPVFPAHKLIELYVCNENIDSNEVDFKKALDLVQFLPQPSDDEPENIDEMRDNIPDAEETKLFIWCRTIMKDSWENINCTSDPLEACKHTTLAKTLNLVKASGMLEECLPDVEGLLEREELGALRESATTQYLIRAEFEHVQRMMSVH